MHHISELFDLDDLAQQEQAAEFARKSIRIVSKSGSEITAPTETSDGFEHSRTPCNTPDPMAHMDDMIELELPLHESELVDHPMAHVNDVIELALPLHESDIVHNPISSKTPHTMRETETSDDYVAASNRNTSESSSSGATIVVSPSGQLLDLQSYLARPDRPLNIAERQAGIKAKLNNPDSTQSERSIDQEMMEPGGPWHYLRRLVCMG